MREADRPPKKVADQLAVAGAPPAFVDPLHVGRPNLPTPAPFLARVESMFERRWLTNDGPYVHELERRIAERLGVRHCVAMSNGTVALEIAIRALGLEGQVIVPAFTFVATAHALQWQGISPVFCDVDPQTHTIDPASVEKVMTSRTAGIIGVHLWGRTCDVDALEKIAKRHGIRLLFDAAHAFGVRHRGVSVGGFGDAEIFSFHATKILNTFEGGAVTTNDHELADKMRLMRNFGFEGLDEVNHVGTNGKMSEIAAAMGLSTLEEFDTFVAASHAVFNAYSEALAGVRGVRVVESPPDATPNFHYVVVEIDELEAGLSRDELWRVLWSENVRARRYFYPGVHRMAPYRDLDPNARYVLPVTEDLVHRVLVLPGGATLNCGDVRVVADIIRTAATSSAKARALLDAWRVAHAELP